jgi:uncharacterized protein
VRRDDVLAILAQHRDELRELGVSSLALFGSVARDEARPDSDVDVLVDFDRPVGLLHLARVRRRLSQLLGANVDLLTPDGVHPALRDHIFAEAFDAAV